MKSERIGGFFGERRTILCCGEETVVFVVVVVCVCGTCTEPVFDCRGSNVNIPLAVDVSGEWTFVVAKGCCSKANMTTLFDCTELVSTSLAVIENVDHDATSVRGG